MSRAPRINEVDLPLVEECLQSILDVVEFAQDNPSAKVRVASVKAVQDECFALVTFLALNLGSPPPEWAVARLRPMVEAAQHMTECVEALTPSEAAWDLACEALTDACHRMRDAARVGQPG
jgi:hypothetical protein